MAAGLELSVNGCKRRLQDGLTVDSVLELAGSASVDEADIRHADETE